VREPNGGKVPQWAMKGALVEMNGDFGARETGYCIASVTRSVLQPHNSYSLFTLGI